MGLEFNTGADHSSIIMPKSPNEARQLAAYDIDSIVAKRPPVPSRNEEARMIDALNCKGTQSSTRRDCAPP